MEENINVRKVVKLEELLPFTDDQFFQYDNQDFDELVESIRTNNHEYGYWVYVRPDTNDPTSGKYEVDSGHEIVRAAEKAGLDSVTIIIMPSQEELDSCIQKEHDSYPLEDEEVYFGAFNNFKKLKSLDLYDDVKIIIISKLIPYNRYSLELFKGKRFEDMVNSVQEMGVVQPIIVRPTKNGMYEILNGHYRFAAAKELKLNVVPAVIVENLTDEEALFLVSETSPLGLHVRHGININEPAYKQSEEYKKMQNARVFSDDNFSMALDEYIERLLLPNNEVLKTYESKYDMGNPSELKDTDCNYNSLANDIADKGISIDVTIFNKPGGLIKRLKKYSIIDLTAFNMDNPRNKREKYKMLYFFYMLEKRDFPKTNILEMLSKLSMENIDNSFIVRETSNGRFIKVIKHELEKELTLQVKDNIKGALAHVADTWGSFLINIPMKMDHLAMCGYEYDFDGVINLLKAKSNNQSERKGVEHSSLSPVTALYLKVAQHEYLGQIKDLLMVCNLQEVTEYIVPQEYIEEMKEYRAKKININNLDAFFTVEKIQEVAKFVYLKSETSKDERRTIRTGKKGQRSPKEKVFKFLDFCYLSELAVSEDEEVSELLIISCLQAIVLDDQNEIFDYMFHGYKGKGLNRKETTYVQAALKSDRHTYEALQVYWVRKVIDRWYANAGKYDELRKLRELEKVCFGILEEILSCSTIEEMLRLNSLYFGKLSNKI